MTSCRLPTFHDILPSDLVEFLRGKVSAEFATVSAAGVPINTPTFIFPDDALTTIDLGTGLAYPAKAERARRNRKVGLLLEGGADDPVISIAGHAAVADGNIQANLERYLAETIFAPNVDPQRVPWEATRERLYYLARVLVSVAPVHIRWWRSRAAMHQRPQEWRGSAAGHRKSDPAPASGSSTAPAWRQPSWRELATQAIDGGMPAHLSLLDPDGYPVPFRVEEVRLEDDGFSLDVPAGAPWDQGCASLAFVGKENFVGRLAGSGGRRLLRVERALPVLPMMDHREALPDASRDALSMRLREELARRGQPMPVVPRVPPAPTSGALRRRDVALAIDVTSIGAGLSS